ncbi:MAG: sulfatase [Puniceicoccaceae bacterium]
MLSPSPKNILFLLSDQHHADHMGCAGHPQAITPNLDRLARMGTRFTQAYTQNPICLPSRVSLLSGQYCHNHGFYGNHASPPHKLPSFLGYFRQHGYRSALIGKVHLPDQPEPWLKDHVDCLLDTPQYAKWIRDRGKEPDHIGWPEFGGQHTSDARPSDLSFEESFEGWSVAKAREFIEAGGETPFCMELSFNRPHHSLTPAREFWDLYPEDLPMPDTWQQDDAGRPPHFRNMVAVTSKYEGPVEPRENLTWQRRNWKGYLACITHTDHAIGQILDYLEESGKLKDTIIIYGSDHGGYHHNHGILEKAPGICSDAVCKVPFIWAGAGIRESTTCDALVENIDLVPTIADLADLPPMDWVDGTSMRPLLEGTGDAIKEEAVTENPRSKAIRWDNWRLVHYPRGMFGNEDVGELYDIIKDPNETTNLYASPAYRVVVEEGRRRLLEWTIRTRRIRCYHGGPHNGEYAGDGFLPRKLDPEKEIEEANRKGEIWRLNYM